MFFSLGKRILVDVWARWVSAHFVALYVMGVSKFLYEVGATVPIFSDKVTPKFEGTHQRSHNQ